MSNSGALSRSRVNSNFKQFLFRIHENFHEIHDIFCSKIFFFKSIIYKKHQKMQQLRVSKNQAQKTSTTFYLFKRKIKKFSCTSLGGIPGFQSPKLPWKSFSCCFICAWDSFDDSPPVYQVAKKEKHQEFHILTLFFSIFSSLIQLFLLRNQPQTKRSCSLHSWIKEE